MRYHDPGKGLNRTRRAVGPAQLSARPTVAVDLRSVRGTWPGEATASCSRENGPHSAATVSTPAALPASTSCTESPTNSGFVRLVAEATPARSVRARDAVCVSSQESQPMIVSKYSMNPDVLEPAPCECRRLARNDGQRMSVPRERRHDVGYIVVAAARDRRDSRTGALDTRQSVGRSRRRRSRNARNIVRNGVPTPVSHSASEGSVVRDILQMHISSSRVSDRSNR